MELVKNAYDALAAHVQVRIRSVEHGAEASFIEVIDDGHGMDYATIRDVWCVIATPFRMKQSPVGVGESDRTITGEKGLGRLSAARLGSEIEVTTRMRGGEVLRFSLNWNDLLATEVLEDTEFYVSRLPVGVFDGEHGTKIRIGKLKVRGAKTRSMTFGSTWLDLFLRSPL